jgi:hypothetical protein
MANSDKCSLDENIGRDEELKLQLMSAIKKRES